MLKGIQMVRLGSWDFILNATEKWTRNHAYYILTDSLCIFCPGPENFQKAEFEDCKPVHMTEILRLKIFILFHGSCWLLVDRHSENYLWEAEDHLRIVKFGLKWTTCKFDTNEDEIPKQISVSIYFNSYSYQNINGSRN